MMVNWWLTNRTNDNAPTWKASKIKQEWNKTKKRSIRNLIVQHLYRMHPDHKMCSLNWACTNYWDGVFLICGNSMLPYLQQCNLIFLRNFRKCWQTLSKLNNQLYCQNGDLGDVTKMNIVLILVFIRRTLLFGFKINAVELVNLNGLTEPNENENENETLTIMIRFKSSSDGCS